MVPLLTVDAAMIDCVHAQRLLPLFYDNELDSPLRRALQDHVVTCPRCTRTLALLERGQELLRFTLDESLEDVGFSEFWNGVERKLTQEPQQRWRWRRQLWWETWRSLWGWPSPAWIATTATLCVGLGIFAWQRPSFSPSDSPTKELPFQITESNQAQIESLSASDTVLVWNEPMDDSTVIWVSDEGEGE